MKKSSTFGRRNMCDHTPVTTHAACNNRAPMRIGNVQGVGGDLEVDWTVVPPHTIYLVNFHVYTIDRVKESC